MRKIDFLIVVGLIALGAGYWARPHQTRPAHSATPVRQNAPTTGVWQVDGISVSDTPATLAQRFGQARRVDRDSDVDQYWFATPSGEAHISYFHAEKSMGVSGNCLLRNDKVVVFVRDSEAMVRRALGQPLRVDQGKDFVALQYSGARVYLKEGAVSGVVIEGYPDPG